MIITFFQTQLEMNTLLRKGLGIGKKLLYTSNSIQYYHQGIPVKCSNAEINSIVKFCIRKTFFPNDMELFKSKVIDVSFDKPAPYTFTGMDRNGKLGLTGVNIYLTQMIEAYFNKPIVLTELSSLSVNSSSIQNWTKYRSRVYKTDYVRPSATKSKG